MVYRNSKYINFWWNYVKPKWSFSHSPTLIYSNTNLCNQCQPNLSDWHSWHNWHACKSYHPVVNRPLLFFYEGTFVAFASGHNLVVDYFQPQAVFQIQRSIKTQIEECKNLSQIQIHTLLSANTSTQVQIQNCNLVVVLVRPQAISQNPLRSFLQLVVVHKNEENIPLSLLACK